MESTINKIISDEIVSDETVKKVQKKCSFCRASERQPNDDCKCANCCCKVGSCKCRCVCVGEGAEFCTCKDCCCTKAQNSTEYPCCMLKTNELNVCICRKNCKCNIISNNNLQPIELTEFSYCCCRPTVGDCCGCDCSDCVSDGNIIADACCRRQSPVKHHVPCNTNMCADGTIPACATCCLVPSSKCSKKDGNDCKCCCRGRYACNFKRTLMKGRTALVS